MCVCECARATPNWEQAASRRPESTNRLRWLRNPRERCAELCASVCFVGLAQRTRGRRRLTAPSERDGKRMERARACVYDTPFSLSLFACVRACVSVCVCVCVDRSGELSVSSAAGLLAGSVLGAQSAQHTALSPSLSAHACHTLPVHLTTEYERTHTHTHTHAQEYACIHVCVCVCVCVCV